VPNEETSINNNIISTGYNPATWSSEGEEYSCAFVFQPQLTEASKSRQRRAYDFNKQDEAELSGTLHEDQKMLQPQLTEASKSRQRRGCDFNEQDEAECYRFLDEVPYVGTSVYTGTNSISTGYYTATGSSAYGNTERGENNSAFHFGDGESETPGASDCGYASSVYTACPGRGKTYSQHVHYPFVQSSENRDIDTYGFPSSSHYDSHTLCTTPTELDTGDTYTCIGAVHRTQDRNTLTHFWRNVLRPVMCLKCITSQNKEEECPQPMMNTSSRNQAGLRRARQKQNQQDETNHGSPSEINTDYITLKLEDPYAVYSIA
ncbi:uncharacterized protein LOC110444937, partial [Mizuhopecten yessoensis]|uniref:uncharacterized protein LOC110444937 n=1 Tax=Mizuhopecten yessoensis TaxID=6573 RepID=UPI000B459497